MWDAASDLQEAVSHLRDAIEQLDSYDFLRDANPTLKSSLELTVQQIGAFAHVLDGFDVQS
jgi:hypothetical protein